MGNANAKSKKMAKVVPRTPMSQIGIDGLQESDVDPDDADEPYIDPREAMRNRIAMRNRQAQRAREEAMLLSQRSSEDMGDQQANRASVIPRARPRTTDPRAVGTKVNRSQQPPTPPGRKRVWGKERAIAGMIDPGCSTTMMSNRTYLGLLAQGAQEVMAPQESISCIKYANGQVNRPQFRICLEVEVNDRVALLQANVFENPGTPFLIGLNFLRAHHLQLNYHPDGDKLMCPALGLINKPCPTDGNGLDVLPFFIPFPERRPGKRQTTGDEVREKLKAG